MMPTRALAALAAALCVVAAHAAQQQDFTVPGTSRPQLLVTPGGAKAGAGAASLPLLVFLRGMDCAYTPQEIASIPGSAQVLASSVNIGVAKSGKDDMAVLAASAADELGAVAAVLTPPRSATTCTLCPAAVKAAQALPPGDPQREFTLAGATLVANGTASGVDCPAWDSGPVCCLASPAPRGDIDFILAAVDAVIEKAPAANRSAVTVIGFSAGAFMASRMACSAPAGRVASILAYAGSEPGTECDPPQARGVLLMHGVHDLQIPFEGAPAGSGLSYPSAEVTLANWARRNGCVGTPHRVAQGGVDVVTYGGCAAPTFGWFLREWGHLPPKSSGPLFVDAIKQVISRG